MSEWLRWARTAPLDQVWPVAAPDLLVAVALIALASGLLLMLGVLIGVVAGGWLFVAIKSEQFA